MNVIEEIKTARKNRLNDAQKEEILTFVKRQLAKSYTCVIYGAPHFGKWEFRDERLEAPYSLHPAIEVWLTDLGFQCSRYYNKMGVEQGLEVRI